ncbi:hypothetical protein [Plebeiibacterium sediminum]|uniref:SGNH/GDSL hydrolase family protein n=1 Tax=Plebeiibacterium sediminum TaxID=2992112 RepID=A0AAE3M3Q6_9BACT|nr:hypothetical protein [Plebeiobacterium sediminum]MCW3786637.1 hypothetical protein [Plebeiobacterium sediminum]
MKKYFKIIIISFFILALCDYLIGKGLNFYYLKNTSGLLYRTTYSLDSTKADILIFGSSRANHHYNVKIIEDSTNLSAYNTGSDGHYIFYQTAVLKSVLKRYTPKKIILDFNGTFEFSQQDYDALSCLLPYYRTHNELKDLIELKSPFEKYKLFSKIYPFNSLLTTIIIGNLEINKFRSVNKGAYKGFVPLTNTWEYNINIIDKPEKYNIDKHKYNAFNDFIKLCNEKNIPLTIIYSPVYFKYNKDYSIDICSEICRKNNVTFLDYSKDTDFLNNKKLFADTYHLNKSGAQLFTQKILQFIKH